MAVTIKYLTCHKLYIFAHFNKKIKILLKAITSETLIWYQKRLLYLHSFKTRPYSKERKNKCNASRLKYRSFIRRNSSQISHKKFRWYDTNS